MDIQITLWELMQAYNDGDHARIAELLQVLLEWNAKSLLLPRVLYDGGVNSNWIVGRTGRFD
jgi:hypothetical protein